MEWDKISELKATVSENVSQGILQDIFLTQRGWVFYSTNFEIATIKYINRYLASHARVPGILPDSLTLGLVPIDIVRVKSGDLMMEGAVFLNGATLRLHTPTNVVDYLLMQRSDAEFWNYPPTYKDVVEEKNDEGG